MTTSPCLSKLPLRLGHTMDRIATTREDHPIATLTMLHMVKTNIQMTMTATMTATVVKDMATSRVRITITTIHMTAIIKAEAIRMIAMDTGIAAMITIRATTTTTATATIATTTTIVTTTIVTATTIAITMVITAGITTATMGMETMATIVDTTTTRLEATTTIPTQVIGTTQTGQEGTTILITVGLDIMTVCMDMVATATTTLTLPTITPPISHQTTRILTERTKRLFCSTLETAVTQLTQEVATATMRVTLATTATKEVRLWK